MAYQIVVQRGDFLVGGVITAIALAGFVGIPADLGAGRGFGGVGHQIVVQRGKLCVCGIVAARAGVVFVPAFFGTGRCFGGVGVSNHGYWDRFRLLFCTLCRWLLQRRSPR